MAEREIYLAFVASGERREVRGERWGKVERVIYPSCAFVFFVDAPSAPVARPRARCTFNTRR